MKSFPLISLVLLLSIFASSRCFDFFGGDTLRRSHFDDDFANWRKERLKPLVRGEASAFGFVWPFSNDDDEPISREVAEYDQQEADNSQSGLRVVGLERDRESLESDAERLPATLDGSSEVDRQPPVRPYKPDRPPLDTSSLFQHHFNTFFSAPETSFLEGGFPGFGFFDLQHSKPWWKGENVCVEREEQDEEVDGEDNHEIAVDGGNFQSFGVFNMNFESCAERQNKHVCTSVKNNNGRKRTVKVTRQCCHGYARPRNGPPNAQCEKVDLHPIAETAERLGAKEFVATLKKSGLESMLEKDLTLFAVPDSAYSQFTEQMWENNLVAFDPVMRAKRQADISGMTARDLILAHAVNGSYHIEDVSNEQLLKTELEGTNIRVNIFPRGPSDKGSDHPYRYTANCAPLLKLNHVAEKGIVHVVDRVLLPVRRNIMQIIRARDDMTVLRTILEKTGLSKMLEEVGNDKHFTVFAPNDDAFLKLDKDIRRKLKAGSGCATRMVEVKQSQTAAFLKTKILDTLAEYNVPIENIFSVTVDNGANMVAAVKKLRQELEQALLEKLDDGNEDFEKTTDDHEPERDISAELCVEFQERINLVRCAVHTLQLSILDVVNKSHESVKGLTELARKSKNMKYQTNFDHHNATHPQIWCQTRWGGIFEMVEAFKTQRTFFEQLAAQFPELDLTNHWKFIDDYYEAFKPLYICTKRMQAEHVSLPDFYMLWLRAISEVRKVTGNQFVPGLLTSLNTRLTTLRGSRAFKMALFLDPRFNYRGSKFFSPEEKMEIMGYINETWQRIRQLQSPASTSSTRNESLSESERNDDFDEYLTEMYGGSVNTDGEPSETKFLQQLQSLDLEPRQNSNYNVWDHWLRRKTTHPELYAVAMVVLSTPSNQVSVERAFSVLGLVLSNLRTKLAEDTLTNILLVKLNKALFPQAIATAYNWKEVERN